MGRRDDGRLGMTLSGSAATHRSYPQSSEILWITGTSYSGTVAIYVDPPRWSGHGRLWSHLVSDDSVEELHAFAAAAGIPRRAYEGDHYDVPAERYQELVAAGALPVETRQLLRILVDSGLRMRKRHGDNGILRVKGAEVEPGRVSDVDLFRSLHEVPESGVFAAVVMVRDRVGDFALVRSRRRDAWNFPGGRRHPGESVRAAAVREVREETGLSLPPEMLLPYGYERFRTPPVDNLSAARADLLQLYAVSLADRRPPLTSAHPDTTDRRWATPEQLRELCSSAFWWPLVEPLLTADEPAQGSAQDC